MAGQGKQGQLIRLSRTEAEHRGYRRNTACFLAWVGWILPHWQPRNQAGARRAACHRHRDDKKYGKEDRELLRPSLCHLLTAKSRVEDDVTEDRSFRTDCPPRIKPRKAD